VSPDPSARSGEIEAWLDAFLRDPAFLAKYPYHAATLARMHPVADPSVQRMAVSLHDGRFYLHVHVESFLREPQYLRGVLLHEVHHVVLGHLTHPKFVDVSEPELMDLAVEMSANEHIEEPLPSPVTWRDYAAVGIRAGQSTMERYEKLVHHLQSTGSRPRPSPGDGATNAGKRVDDHRFLRHGDTIAGGLTQTRSLVEEVVKETVARHEKATAEMPDWDRPPVPRFAGQSPGRILEELGGALKRPEHFLDWKTAVRMFVANARAPVHTYSRPSRRFPGLIGVLPGRTYVPRAIAKPRIVVALDTSLSMTLRELEEIARQLARLSEHATITICECDVEITRTYPFEGKLPSIVGRGGTDLRPVFAREHLGRMKADGVIYFTDGDGPFPATPAPLPVLWVLTKPEAFHCPWGQRAWLGRGPSPRRVLPPPTPPKPPKSKPAKQRSRT
jgi:predicted metal-dependent peptidase